jgi:serine/threonine-protein kinase
MALFKKTRTHPLLDSINRKNRYHILGRIGRGQITEVFNAFDATLNRIVAVKKLDAHSAGNPDYITLFMNEARLISYLDHQGIVQLYDTFLDENDVPCYAMKLLEGETLRAHIKPRTVNQNMRMLITLCEIMAHVHDKGGVHLDLKPENIMVGHYGEVVLIDWDGARIFDDRPYKKYLQLVKETPIAPIEDVATSGSGTPAYMSPEQTLRPREELGPESDIFSAGIIFYELLCARRPFSGNSAEELTHAIRNYAPVSLHERNRDVPLCLSQICNRMLNKDPFSRYHSFHEVLHDIDVFYNSGQAFQTRSYKVNDIIFREGETGDFAFMVISGEVAVFKQVANGQYKELARLGKDEIVGELAILTNEKRSATIVASKSDTVIRIMGRQDVETEMEKLSPWVGKMITGLSRRFIDLDTQIVSLTRQMQQPPHS